MKRKLLIFAILLTLLFTVSAAAGEGCMVDQYGCYITDEDGQMIYLMFWSEAARKYIMGDLSAPGTGIIDKPADISIGMVMDNNPEPVSTALPVFEPTLLPTIVPTQTEAPTLLPTTVPTGTAEPTLLPTTVPTQTVEPTLLPTTGPTETEAPTLQPTSVPTETEEPTQEPETPDTTCMGALNWLQDIDGYTLEGETMNFIYYTIVTKAESDIPANETQCSGALSYLKSAYSTVNPYKCFICLMDEAMTLTNTTTLRNNYSNILPLMTDKCSGICSYYLPGE